MRPYYPDTDPKMEALQIQLLRQAAPWRKMQMVSQLNHAARTLAVVGLRRRFPYAGEGEIQGRLARLLLGDELARKVYGEFELRN